MLFQKTKPTSTAAYREAYPLGRRAGENGAMPTDNPHAQNSPAWIGWDHGCYDAQSQRAAARERFSLALWR